MCCGVRVEPTSTSRVHSSRQFRACLWLGRQNLSPSLPRHCCPASPMYPPCWEACRFPDCGRAIPSGESPPAPSESGCTGSHRRLRTSALQMPERAGHIRLRNRALLDRPNRLAGVAIKHSEKAVLGRPRDDVDFFPSGDRQQLWRRHQVVVPEIMVRCLEMPQILSGACMHLSATCRIPSRRDGVPYGTATPAYR
jgi:hypothetical protein